jgi:hypothetical protein
VIIGIFVILTLIPVSFLATSQLSADSLKKFDLPGMLKEIDAKTRKLGEINKEILAGLDLIDTKSAKTLNVSDRLGAANHAAKKEDSTLGSIRDVTGQQVTLSQELNRLSQALTGLMNAISGHSSTQSGSSRELLKTTVDTRENLGEVLRQNQLLEQKLEEAARKSEQAARSMP